MTRRKKILLSTAIFLSVVLVIAWFATPSEPSHQGLPLSAWLKDLESPESEKRRAAQDAIRAMGTKAVPFLTRSLEQRQSAAVRFYRGNVLAQKWFRGLRQKLKWHEPVMESRNAAAALATLGPAADSAIPNLIAALSDYSPLIAQEAANALGKMPRAVPHLIERLRAAPTNDSVWVIRSLTILGPEARETAPELARLVHTANPVADFSVIALARIGAPAIPFMTNSLNDPNLAIRIRASSFFWQLGTNAIYATNILFQSAFDTNATVRSQIWNALVASRAPQELTRPVWVRGLQDPAPQNATVALHNLSNDPTGVLAHNHEIMEIFRTHPDPNLRRQASNVLSALTAWPKK